MFHVDLVDFQDFAIEIYLLIFIQVLCFFSRFFLKPISSKINYEKCN